MSKKQNTGASGKSSKSGQSNGFNNPINNQQAEYEENEEQSGQFDPNQQYEEGYDPNQGQFQEEQEGYDQQEDPNQFYQQDGQHGQYYQQHGQQQYQEQSHSQYPPEPVDKHQLDSIKEIVYKLNHAEAKIHNLKKESHPKAQRIERKHQEVKDLSETLLQQIRENPVSRKPDLDQHINKGVELAIVESGAQVQRLKDENNELKDIIKTKNRYIESIQEKYRQLKKDYDEKVAELEKLKLNMDHQAHEINHYRKKQDNEYKVNALRENVRAAKKDEYVPKKEENYVDAIPDDYDFWKTANDKQIEEYTGTTSTKPKNRLENMFQGGNQLFVHNKDAKEINFETLKLSGQYANNNKK